MNNYMHNLTCEFFYTLCPIKIYNNNNLLLLQVLQLHSLNVLTFSTYNFHLLQSWMQLVQFLIFSFFISFVISSSHLFFGLPSGSVNIDFHLYTLFTILSAGIRCKWPNQLYLCVLCDLLYSYVLLIHLIHYLF